MYWKYIFMMFYCEQWSKSWILVLVHQIRIHKSTWYRIFPISFDLSISMAISVEHRASSDNWITFYLLDVCLWLLWSFNYTDHNVSITSLSCSIWKFLNKYRFMTTFILSTSKYRLLWNTPNCYFPLLFLKFC